MFPSEGSGTIRHVPGGYATIQAGINAAQNGDTVLVASGTYTGAGNRNLSFGGKSILLTSAAGPSLTTINCQYLGRALFLHEGEDTNAVVNGFTLARGAPGAPGSLVLVGGGSSPVIRDCVIERSQGVAGIVRVESGSPKFTSCTVEEDTVVTTGAAMVFVGGSPKVVSCVIHHNVGPSALRVGTPTLISGTKIVENDGVGVYFDTTSTSMVVNSEISRNTARGVILDASSATFDGVVFQENGGGGVRVIGSGGLLTTSRSAYAPATFASSTTDFIDCEFSGHSTDRGAGFFFDCTNEPEIAYTVTFTNCQFTGNHAVFEGGGVAICGRANNADITAVFTNCTIAANSAHDGGGVYMGVTDIGIGRSAHAQFTRTILWGNCSTVGALGEAFVMSGNELTIDCSHTELSEIAGTGAVYSSLVTAGIPYFCDYPGTYWGTGCYPDATIEGDFGLAPESPAAPEHHPCGPAQIGAFPVEDCVASPIVDEPVSELDTELRPAAPNPFNPVTTLEFTLKTNLHVTLTIYDVTGRVAKTLVDRPMAQGEHRIEWDGRDQRGNPAASGVYFLRFEAGQTRRTQKMVLVK
jgi:hypothetical protein